MLRRRTSLEQVGSRAGFGGYTGLGVQWDRGLAVGHVAGEQVAGDGLGAAGELPGLRVDTD